MKSKVIVFFRKNEHFPILQKLLGDFGHVFVVIHDNYGIHVAAEFSYFFLNVHSVLPLEIDRFKSEYIYVELEIDRGTNFMACMPGFRSCVNSVKAVLGIRKPFIITPRQLYSYLVKIKSQPAD